MEINGLTLNLNVFEANQAQKLVDSYESVANEAERAQGKACQNRLISSAKLLKEHLTISLEKVLEQLCADMKMIY